MNTNKLLFTIIALFFLNVKAVLSQEELKPIIKGQAEKISMAIYTEDWESLVAYTHPAILKASGGKEVMIEAVKKMMEGMEAMGAKIEKLEILDSIVVSKYEDEYHCLVPKVMTMTVNDQTIIGKSYLFGFSDLKGKEWTFVESDQLISDVGKMVFPGFKTNIDIPAKPDPIIIDNMETEESEEEGKLEIRLSWEKTNIKIRHEVEAKLDKLMREQGLGYCFGGENGEEVQDYVMVNLELNVENKDAVMELIEKHISPNDYGEFELIIFEK